MGKIAADENATRRPKPIWRVWLMVLLLAPLWVPLLVVISVLTGFALLVAWVAGTVKKAVTSKT